MSSSLDFKSLVDGIVAKYEELDKENRELKAENAALKKQLAQFTQNQSSPMPSKGQIRKQPNSAQSIPQTRKAQIPFWQSKTRIKMEWATIPIDFSDSLLCVHNSNESNIIALGSADSAITLYSTESKSQLATVQCHKGAINCIVSDKDTGLFASCSGDCNISVWSPQLTSPFQGMRKASFDQDVIKANTILTHHAAPVTSATWVKSDGHLISGSYDNTICLWDVTHSASCIKIEDVKSPVLTIDSLGNGDSIAAGLMNGEIRFLDTRSSASTVMTAVHGKCPVIQLKFVEDVQGIDLITGGGDSKICEWDSRNLSEPVVSIDIDRSPTKFCVSGKHAFIPCEIGHIRIVNLENNEIYIVETMPFSYSISSADYINTNDCTIVAASWDGTAAIGKYKFK